MKLRKSKTNKAKVAAAEEAEGQKKQRFKTFLLHGTKYKTTYNKKYENRKKYTPADPKQIISVIPGTVLELFVKEGQKVNSGEEIMVLEAMKMHNRILFPYDGVVKSVNVTTGQSVPKGYVMVEYE